MFGLEEIKHMNDFTDFLSEKGLTTDDVAKAAKTMTIPEFSYGEESVHPGDSKIQGKGIFSSRDFIPGEYISKLHVYGKWTASGMLINHSVEPNARFILRDGVGIIESISAIPKNTEITVNYREVR